MSSDEELLVQAMTLDFLARTWEWARSECRYWREVGGAAIRSVADFRELPLLERDTVRERLVDLCPRGLEPSSYTATSGTSTGHPLLVPRRAQEGRARAEYRISTRAAKPQADPGDGLVLRLHPAGRVFRNLGTPRELGFMFLPNSANELTWDNWDAIISQIFASFPSETGQERIRILHATPAFGLTLLTRHMLQRGVPPSETEVRQLIVTGSHVPVHKRAWLAQTWNASFLTTFSCSEIPGWASECARHPGRYHFDHTLFPEVVQADSSAHVEPGEEGRLVLTGIHPFQSACALLRYVVGDWARWLGYERCDCGVFAPTIEHLGRASRIVRMRLGSGACLTLSPVPVSEALAAFDFVPDVPRAQFHYRATGNQRLELHVECYHLRTPEWEQRTTQLVRQAVLAREPQLAQHALEFTVRLRRRGELTTHLEVR
jgi:phenylacetate-coenzyme A ligase PaaK-like adenylate-forming protein